MQVRQLTVVSKWNRPAQKTKWGRRKSCKILDKYLPGLPEQK